MSNKITFVLEGDAENLEVVLKRAKDNVNRFGDSAKQAGQDSASGFNTASNAASKASSVFRQGASEIGRMGQAGLSFGRNIEAGANRGKTAADKILSTLVHIRAAVASLAATSLGIEGVRTLGELADGYTNLSSRIRTVSTSEDELNRIRERTFSIAQRTRTSYEDTVTLYARLTRATQTLGLNEQQRLRITETINKAYIVSGATLQEASNSIIQLTQALASGVLRGEEFNSVAEQGPIILDLLSKSLGKTRGELRQMAKQGQLTAEVVSRSILQGSSLIDGQFAQMTMTIEGSWIRVTNAWQKFIGETSDANGTATTIARTFSALADNIGSIATALLKLGEVLALVFAGRVISAALQYVAALALTVKGVGDVTVAERANLEASIELSQAKSKEALSLLSVVEAAKAEELAKLQVAQANVAAAEAALALAQEEVRLDLAMQVDEATTNALAVAKARLASVTSELAILGRQQAAVEGQVVAATEAQIAAQVELAATQSLAAKGMGALRSAGATLFAAVGGWTTVVIAFGVALYSWITDIEDTSKTLDALHRKLEDLQANNISVIDSLAALISGEKAHKKSLEETAEAQSSAAKYEIYMLKQRQASALQLTSYSGNVVAMAGNWLAYAAKIEYAKYKTKELDETLAAVRVQEFATKVGDAVLTMQHMFGLLREPVKPEIDTNKLNKFTKSISEQIEKTKEQTITMKQGTQAGLEYAAMAELNVKSLDKLPPELRKNIQILAGLKDELSGLKTEHKNSAKEENEHEKQLRRLNEAQQRFGEQLLEQKSQLGGPVTRAWGEYNKQVEKAKDAYFKGEATLAQYAQALEQLGVIRDKDIERAKKENDILGDLNKTMQQSSILEALPERERAIEEAVQRATKAWEDTKDAQVEAGISLQQVQDVARATTGALYDYTKAVDNSRQGVEDAKRVYINFYDGLADAAAGFFTRQIKSWKDFGKSLVNVVSQFVQEVLKRYLLMSFLGQNSQAGGTPFSFFTTLASLFTGGNGATGATGTFSVLGNLFGGANSGGTGNSGFNLLSNASSWYSAGQSLWSGFSSFFGGASGLDIAGNTAAGGINLAPGAGYSVAQNAAAGGINLAGPYNYGSAGSYGAFSTYAGGLLGAYYGLHQGSGGVNTAASTVAYGALGAGIAGTAAGVLGGASLATAAGGAYAAIGAASWIPIVGWIAAAVALVDYISGGKVFGTKYKPKSSTTTFSLGPDGGDVSNSLLEWKYKGILGSLNPIGDWGSKQYKTKQIEANDEQLKLLQELLDQQHKVYLNAAKRLHDEIQPLIESTFTVTNTYDKKGKVKDTKTESTVLGVTRTEDFETYQKRISAEGIIASIDHALNKVVQDWQDSIKKIAGGGNYAGGTGGNNLSQLQGDNPNAPGSAGTAAATNDLLNQATKAAERWRDDVDQLVEGANFLLQAAQDIIEGQGLLVDSSGHMTNTLSELTDMIELNQKDGESLIDTYTRMKESTKLLEDALDQMGVIISKSREDFVQFATDIAEAAGGVQQAAQLWSTYFQEFHTGNDETLASLQRFHEKSNEALQGIGLDATTNMQEFRDKFEAVLPTLSAEDVVKWLKAGDALAQFAAAQQQIISTSVDLLTKMGFLNGSMSDFSKFIADVENQEAQATQAANNLAVATGHTKASIVDLAKIHNWAAQQILQALKKLKQETQDLKFQLGYTDQAGSLDILNQRISELEQSEQDAFDTAQQGIGDVSDSLSNLFDDWNEGLKSLNDYLDQMLFGDLSALTPEQQMAEIKNQLLETQQKALAGDPEALKKLPQLADTYLKLLREQEASGNDFNQGFAWVRQLLQDVANRPNPGTQGQGNSGSGGTVTFQPSAELQAYYNQRDELLAQQETLHRQELARQLAQNLGDMARLLQVPLANILEIEKVSLAQLATDIGVDLDNLTGSSIQALADMANLLGINLTDLTSNLGLNLTDLGAGLKELTDGLGIDFKNLTDKNVESLAALSSTLGLSLSDMLTAMGLNLSALHDGLLQLTTNLGIDLGNLTSASVQQLAELASSLGLKLGELSTSLGINLGELTDKQSLLNQALADTINTLPQAQRDQLRPLFDAVTNATNAADANTAIHNLENATNALPPALRDLLAPYLSGVQTSGGLSDTDYLSYIYSYAQSNYNALVGGFSSLWDKLDLVQQAVNNVGHAITDSFTNNSTGANPNTGSPPRTVPGGGGIPTNVPGYASGIGYLANDEIAQLHQGEAVLPRHVNSWLRQNGFPVQEANNNDDLKDQLKEMTKAIEMLASKIDANGRAITGTEKESCEKVVAATRAAAQQITQAVESRNRNGGYVNR